MVKPVKMILTEYHNVLQSFLISNDEIEVGDMVCELLTTGKWLPMTIHTQNDIDNDRQKKIIATSEELGYIYSKEEVNSNMRLIDLNDIDNILNNDGECAIDMDEYLGEYCGYRTIRYKDKKVIIQLNDE
jgi:hypothetical protein